MFSALLAFVPIGWMTWYAVGFDADERTVLENAAAFQEKFGGCLDEKPVLWVDWEWCHRKFRSRGEDGEDALTPHAKAYPRGLKALAGDLRRMGFTPALWVAPQADVRTNALLAAHREWILGSSPFWGGHVFADSTAPGFYDGYLKPAFDLYRSWGYEMFKWDCMPNTWRFYKEKKDHFAARGHTPESAFRKLLEDGRRAVGGGTYLLYCHASKPYDEVFLPNRRLFTAARIGDDVFDWSAFCRHVVKAYLDFLPYANETMLDVDNLVLREKYSTLAQARTRVTFVALTGLPVTLGDRIADLDEARIGMLRRIMPVVKAEPGSPAPVLKDDLLELTANYVRDDRRWTMRAWSNLSTNRTLTVTVSAPGQATWDVWNERLVSADGRACACPVEPGDTLLVKVTPLEAHGPTLVGATRHLTQATVRSAPGAVERTYWLEDGRIRREER